MNRRYVQWLFAELPTLVSRGVLSADGADRMRQHYAADEGRAGGRRWAVILFSILGAALVASGIILLLAHNWDQLSRPTRAVISFMPLVGAQAVAGWALCRRRDSTAWREGAGTALTLAIGATISLIAQTYNISGDFGAFMLTWTLLALPVVYLLDASVPAVLYLVGVVVWAGDARFAGGESLWYWLLTALVLPHLWRVARGNRLHPRAVVIGWALGSCICFGTGFATDRALAQWWILIYAGLFTTMYLLGNRWSAAAPSWWQRPFQTLGALGIFGLSVMLTYHWPWEGIVAHWQGEHLTKAQAVMTVWVIASALLWIESMVRRRLADSLFGAMTAMAAYGYLAVLGWEGGGPVPVTVLFDLFLLVLGVGALWRGLREDRLGVVNSGMLMISALIVTRFFDSDLGFVVRGLAFIIVGVGFLVTNVVLIRRKGATV